MIWFADSVVRGSNIGQKAGCPSFCSRRGENAGNFELWTPIIAFDWYSGGYTQVHLGPWVSESRSFLNHQIACSLSRHQTPRVGDPGGQHGSWRFLLRNQHIWAPKNAVLYHCVSERVLVQADQFYVHSPNIFITVVDASILWREKKKKQKKGMLGIEFSCREWEIWVIWQAPAAHSLNWYYYCCCCCYCYCYYYHYCLSSLTVCRERWRVNLRQVRQWWFGQHVGEFPVWFYKSLHSPAVPECS